MRLADKQIAEEEPDNPTNNETEHSVYHASKGSPFALGEDAIVERYEAELDQTQTWYLHQLDGPQDLAPPRQLSNVLLIAKLLFHTFRVVCC